jgi:hypothetical protein
VSWPGSPDGNATTTGISPFSKSKRRFHNRLDRKASSSANDNHDNMKGFATLSETFNVNQVHQTTYSIHDTGNYFHLKTAGDAAAGVTEEKEPSSRIAHTKPFTLLTIDKTTSSMKFSIVTVEHSSFANMVSCKKQKRKLWGIQLTPKVLTGYYKERRLRYKC